MKAQLRIICPCCQETLAETMTEKHKLPGGGQLATIVASLLLVLVGLFTPMATLDQIFLPPDTYSLAGGVFDLFAEGELLLGSIIFLFSIVFPIGKVLVLIRVYGRRRQSKSSPVRLGLLEFLGKWSMLDVFVLAITFGAANLGVLSAVEIHWGIYCYGAGVILSIIATLQLSWSCNDDPDGSAAIQGSRLIHGLTLTSFLAGMLLPLAEIEKWIFWERQYSVISALPGLLAAGEYLMPLILFCFVLVLPVMHFLCSGLVRWQSNPSASLRRKASFVEKWAMFDVYALAMLLVFIKISDSAEVQLQAGFWALLAAAALNLGDRFWGAWTGH
jgi:paraquat-inducible protein A